MYKIDKEYYRKKNSKARKSMITFCCIFSIFWIISMIFSGEGMRGIFSTLFILISCCAMICFMFSMIIKENNKIIKQCEYLEKNGVLYHLPFNTRVSYRRTKHGSGYQVVKLEVDYELPSGNKVLLQSDKEYSVRILDDTTLMNGLADVLIDPQNPSKYFVDFKIEEDYEKL